MNLDSSMVTMDDLVQGEACDDLKTWFKDKFPSGGAFTDVATGLWQSQNISGLYWLASECPSGRRNAVTSTGLLADESKGETK